MPGWADSFLGGLSTGQAGFGLIPNKVSLSLGLGSCLWENPPNNRDYPYEHGKTASQNADLQSSSSKSNDLIDQPPIVLMYINFTMKES